VTDLVRTWPPTLRHLLTGLHCAPTGTPGCCCADVDVSEDELRSLHVFETLARHDRVVIPPVGGLGERHGATESVVGLGPPADRQQHVAKVRICFTNVELAVADPTLQTAQP
jgi:hypothetical protein